MTRDETTPADRDEAGDDLPEELRDAMPFDDDDAADGADGATTDDVEHEAEIDGTLVRSRFGVADLIVAIVIGFLFLASGYAALGNLVGLPPYLEAIGIASIPWAPLVVAVVAPVVLFVAAILVGRGRPSFDRALILIVALALNAALGQSLDWFTLAGVQLN
ncbi:hypothetical protein [Schumannella sp. 10F1B-5-1]|uniref:hypothetical protein n=1 Tax=Schumannella sp. 10F1B-5-1 TaxID=2590780 RepID=UPI001130055A|nr:hypothetical protein [Schumannella sp. 10F1B-5-1]TPW73629.1 hypothetical protein FJ658_05460 [Schumannella sp. 10F1B-5-1]